MARSRGFVNQAKSGARALTARQRQAAARARIERTGAATPRARRPPAPRRSKSMSKIEIERNPTAARLAEIGAADWPIWTKECSTFPWTYDAAETCYFLAGQVEVTPDGGAPVHVGQGDLVRFPAGLSCVWRVKAPVRKHYRFG